VWVCGCVSEEVAWGKKVGGASKKASGVSEELVLW